MSRISNFLIFLLFASFSGLTPCPEGRGNLNSYSESETVATSKESAYEKTLLEKRKSEILYSDIPDITRLHLPKDPPTIVGKVTFNHLSPGLTDPLLEEARNRRLYLDFKTLSDAYPRDLKANELDSLKKRAEEAGKSGGRDAFLKTYIEGRYFFGSELKAANEFVKPRWKIKSGIPIWDETFAYIEKSWTKLVRKSPPQSNGSLLPTPYPIIVPAGRFQEIYYWDTYFGVKGLLATNRIQLAQMQIENLLSFIQRFGFIPNGGRDYYISRSQPPTLSTAIHDVYKASIKNSGADETLRLKTWLKLRAYPLLKRDYLYFWMNPNTRYDARTGLNHHWDDINLPRPERHSFDNEKALGSTYRDVRAAAESGLDFTQTLGSRVTQTAGILLNCLLYKTEIDLAWMANEIGYFGEATQFRLAAQRRKEAINKYLWNSVLGRFENFDLKENKRIGYLSADTFVPLFVGLASPEQAKRIRQTLGILEKPGGIMASELIHSPYQWDGVNGWAPQQIFAIQGLLNYCYKKDADRIARKWVQSIAKNYKKNGAIYERLDVQNRNKPVVDHTKYPAQIGFLWTNASYIWAVTHVLGIKLEPAK